MKKLFLATIFSLFPFLALAPFKAHAGPGESCHFHGSKSAGESTILKCAYQRKEKLVSSGKLDKTWDSIKHESITYVDGKKGKEWKVSFVNPEASDKTKNNLFMFFTPPGNFIAANYNGQ